MSQSNNGQKLSRKKTRSHIARLLYSLEFYDKKDYDTMIDRYLDDQEVEDPDDRAQIRKKALAVMDRKDEIDAAIDERSEHWKSKRIARMDLAIIRLAVYEIEDDDEIPMKVAINEAVDLARKYSSDQSPGFINGVLARFAKDHPEK